MEKSVRCKKWNLFWQPLFSCTIGGCFLSFCISAFGIYVHCANCVELWRTWKSSLSSTFVLCFAQGSRKLFLCGGSSRKQWTSMDSYLRQKEEEEERNGKRVERNASTIDLIVIFTVYWFNYIFSTVVPITAFLSHSIKCKNRGKQLWFFFTVVNTVPKNTVFWRNYY